MDESTLGKMLRAVRLERLKTCESAADDLLKSWDESDVASQVVDAECAQRLYMLGLHDALTDAVRLCESEQAKHEHSVEFHAAAKNYLDAGVHAAKANEAKLCANAIRETLKKKGGL